MSGENHLDHSYGPPDDTLKRGTDERFFAAHDSAAKLNADHRFCAKLARGDRDGGEGR